MEHANYSIEDFIAEESFQQYCTGRNEAAIQYWNSYFAAFPEQVRKGKQAKSFYLLLSGNHTADQYNRHFDLFQTKIKKLNNETSEKILKSSGRILRFWIRAACITLVFATSLFAYYSYFSSLNSRPVQYSSKSGERRTITLEDGSIVILNGASKITLSASFNKKSRRLKLDGEAFFNVRHDDKIPFIVEANELIVKDLGTKFNIRAFSTDRTTEASLIEGLIEVSTVSRPDQKVLLKPNQKITYVTPSVKERISDSTQFGKNAKIGTVTKNSINNSILETDWIQNRLTFNDEDFEQIANKIERWYGVKIKFEDPAIKQFKFVATFENESLTEVLDFLKYSRDFNYRKEGDNIIIY